MTLDIAKLRELLAAYQAHGGGLGWTHGELGAAIETSQSDEVHGGTLFAPTDDYRPEDNVWPEIDVAAARLACAAVNALPQLLAIAEAAEAMRDAWDAWGEAAVGLYPNSPLGRLFVALDAARKEGM